MITDEQIAQWAERPSSMLPGLTVQILTDALNGAARLRGKPYEIYVQGSYANETNISPLGDVDIVIQLTMPFEENISGLDPTETRLFREHYEDTDYDWDDFRRDVWAALRQTFFIDEGSRCINVESWDSFRVPADILRAIEYRRYRAFPSLVGELYDEGVFFRTKDGTPIINYPKLHLAEGKQKDRNTAGRFKQIVRVAKNARLQKGFSATAPSYFIECLVYRVPNEQFKADTLATAYRKVVTYLDKHRSGIRDWKCQNGIVDMFDHHPEAWSVGAATDFIEALCKQLDGVP